MNKDIRNHNDKGEWHGYQERYHPNGKIMLRCIYKNNKGIRYQERHHREKYNNYNLGGQTIYYIR
jgi:hypothetical protein